MMTKGREIGLELNLVKCDAFVFGRDHATQIVAKARVQPFSQDISFPTKEKISLLGSLFLPEGIEEAMDDQTSAIHLLTSRLSKLQAHQALFILKNCLRTPKVISVLRRLPTWMRGDKLAVFDSMTRASLADITNTDMKTEKWRQATLSVSKDVSELVGQRNWLSQPIWLRSFC